VQEHLRRYQREKKKNNAQPHPKEDATQPPKARIS
jgi:hypothetical protein